MSESVEEEEHLKREEQILREQELSNLLHHKDYVRAVGVAISLDQPFRVLKILQGQQYFCPGLEECQKIYLRDVSLHRTFG